MLTTSYGTWGSYARTASIGDAVNDFISGGGNEWIGRLVQTGAWDRIVDEFRAAINAGLPDGVTLNGDSFYGPYPLPDNLRPRDLTDIIPTVIDGVDLSRIVMDHDPDLAATPTPTAHGRGPEENYDDVYGLTFPGRIPGAGDTR